MGNSVSSVSGGGANKNNRPNGTKFLVTPNSNELLDGHYVCFYPKLSVEEINNICKSMDGVAVITDLSIIIAGARSTKTKINNKYKLVSVKLREDDNTNATKTTDDNKNDTTTTTKAKESNDFNIELNSNYYLLITPTILFESANDKEIMLKRYLDSSHLVNIKIGSSYEKYTEKYFDAYITDDFKSFKNSSNPINSIENRKFFLELDSVPSIHLKLTTLQVRYNTKYSYATVYKIKTLSEAMTHINTMQNSTNLLGIYYYNVKDLFIRDAMKQFVLKESDLEISDANYYIFSIGHTSTNMTNKTIKFKNRTISLKPNTMTDFKLIFSSDVGSLVPKDIRFGYQQQKGLFISKINDKVTQVFPPTQIIQFSRTNFLLYIGYIDPEYEIDIIGSLLNASSPPTRKFILYCKSDVIGSFSLPEGLYKTQHNGITNIKDLKSGTNISNNYYLTIGLEPSSTTKDYDVVSTGANKLNIKTLRNNEIKAKQALLATHAGDMKEEGAYILDSELIPPNHYTNDDKLVIICAIETTPTAIWNLAKNLLYKLKYVNWIMYFSLHENFTLNECSGFIIIQNDRNMKILCPRDRPFHIESRNSYSFGVILNNEKLFLFSQMYITSSVREKYLGAFSIYPRQIPSSESNYQQYKFSSINKLSYVDYDIPEVQYSLKDNFIGGMINPLVIYSNMKKLVNPKLDQELLSNTKFMFFDYLPTIKNIKIMESYLTAFENFLSQGSNSEIISYTCLMRVRKEWVKTKVPNKQYFEIIEGANKDYCLIFVFGGTKTRYKFNSSTRSFTLNKFQSIVLNSEIAKSKTAQSNTNIYMEDPLDAIIKPSDEVKYLNIPINASFNIKQKTVITYAEMDNLSWYSLEYTDNLGTNIINGNILQPDLSYIRYTYLSQSLYEFIVTINTITSKTDTVVRNGIVFVHINTLDSVNIQLPGFRDAVEKFIRKNPASVLQTYKVIFDNVNQVYIITNIDVVISQKADSYAIRNDPIYIRSKQNPLSVYVEKELILDMLDTKFLFDDNSSTYSRSMFSVRLTPETHPIEYPQVDKAARKSAGVTIKSDNRFWQSIRSFVFIPNLEKFEIANLVEMAKYLSIDLDQFFIISKVSYDITSSEPWMQDRLVVIRGNENAKINIKSKIKNLYYYIKLEDTRYKNDYMKFAVWDSKTPPTVDNLADIDFIINDNTGIEYDNTKKVLSNERIGINTNYLSFSFPNDTLTSFPKFVNFTTGLNKYILFARQIQKDKLNIGTLKNSVAAVELIKLTDNNPINFSEIINFIVQWYTLEKGNLKYIIFSTNSLGNIKKPDKEYKITIDDITYNTSDFTYTDNQNVIIYPKVQNFNKINNTYTLSDKVSYCTKTDNISNLKNDNIVLFSGPPINVFVGANSKFDILRNKAFKHVNMELVIQCIVEK